MILQNTKIISTSQVTNCLNQIVQKAYLQHHKNIENSKKSRQLSKRFPIKCADVLMNLTNIKSQVNFGKVNIVEPSQNDIPKPLLKKKKPFKYIKDFKTNKNVNSMSNSTFTKSHQNSTYQLTQSYKLTGLISLNQDVDQQEVDIDLMRRKKNKLYELQQFFNEKEKARNYDIKRQLDQKQKNAFISKRLYTTDYNGQTIQIKKLNIKRTFDCSRVNLKTSVRQEKEDINYPFSHEDKKNVIKNYSKKIVKMENKKKQMMVTEESQDTQAKKSNKDIHLTLKDFSCLILNKTIGHRMHKKKEKKISLSISKNM